MLALVRSHERALRLNDSKFMREISKALDDEMVKVFKDQILAA
jgi:hypothetical protein